MLFADHALPADFQTDSLKDILDYYEKKSEEYGLEVEPPEHVLTFEGDKLSQRGKTTEAMNLFTYQRKLYPRSLNALFRLGELHRRIGEFERARDFYQQFLEIRDVDAAMTHRRLNEVKRILDSSAAYRIERELRKNGVQAGLEKYREIRSDPTSRLCFEESEFNAMGYRLLGSGRPDDAVEVFKLNLELYPESANAYAILGEAYMMKGDAQSAIDNYRKSLQINPDNKNAEEKLRLLQKKQ